MEIEMTKKMVVGARILNPGYRIDTKKMDIFSTEVARKLIADGSAIEIKPVEKPEVPNIEADEKPEAKKINRVKKK